MKYLLQFMVTIGCGAMLLNASAFSDDSNTNPTTGIDVVRGAVKELEDELAKRGSQGQLNSDDYKAWNQKFRAQLNQALDSYEQHVETEVVVPLQPLTDRYNTISMQTELRDDQIGALKNVTLKQLQTIADTLAPKKKQIYQQMFDQVFPFLPRPKIKYLGNKLNSVNIFGDTHFTKAAYQVDVSTIGSSNIAPLSKECDLIDASDEKSFETIEGTQAWYFATKCTKKAEYMSDYMGSPQIPDDLQPTFQHFIVPFLKDGCESQLCMTLKVEDVLLTMRTLANRVDQPFKVSFADGNSVLVNSAQLDTSIYETMLSMTYVDPSLPFSLGGSN